MRSLAVLFFMFLGFHLAAQRPVVTAAELEYLFAHKKYAASYAYYEQLIAPDSLNVDLNYKLGICYMNSRSQKEKAIRCFRRVLHSGSLEPPLFGTVSKLMADACYAASYFDEAILHYENYKNAVFSGKEAGLADVREINRQIEMCSVEKELKELKELVASMINTRLTEAGTNTSAEALDYSSSSSAGRLSIVFTLRSSAHGVAADKNFFEEKFISVPPEIINKQPENKDTTSAPREATVATSVDGQFMLTYRNEDGMAQLYTSALQGNSWSAPQKLDRPVNNKGWEPNEFISADGSALYFTSSRPGGLGGKDIYKCSKLPNGDWSKAINPGYPVNTSFDDEAPFIHPDGTTLFFSSNRAKSKKGGFDVFTSTLSDSGWCEVRNVGYPIDKTKAEKTNFSPETKNTLPEKENYRVSFSNTRKAPLTLVKGKILNLQGNPVPSVTITILDNETGDTTGIYYPEARSGQYIFILPSLKNNQVVYESDGYLFHTENMAWRVTALFRLDPTIELAPMNNEAKDLLNNIFFNEGLATLHRSSFFALNTLYNFLEKNPAVRIEISCLLPAKDKNQAEITLLEERLQSVTNYLQAKGIAKDRIHTRVNHSSKKRSSKNMQAPVENKIQIRYWK